LDRALDQEKDDQGADESHQKLVVDSVAVTSPNRYKFDYIT
jgi:hypothetical protein